MITSMPTIHSNGTDKETLLDGVFKVQMALDGALNAMYSAMPHGRDYYPQGDSAYAVARAEWNHRIEQVRTMKNEFQDLAMGLAER